MRRWSTWVIGVAALLLIGLAIAQNLDLFSRGGAVETAAKPGFMAPSFELTGWDGKVYRAGGPRDKPLLVNFWASWCGPCHMEAPDLQALYEKYEGQIDLYAVNVTTTDTRTGIAAFIEEYGLTFPIPLDETGKVTSRAFGVDGYPASFLIDRNGIVVDAVFGIINRDKLERQFDRLLAEGERQR